MKPERKQIQVELTDEEKLIINLLQSNDSQMDLAELKNQSELSGKKWDKAMKSLNSLGMTEVRTEGDSKICALKLL